MRKAPYCPDGPGTVESETGGSQNRLNPFELMEEALRESEQRYRVVLDNVDIGIALISPSMEILSLNNQMRRWFPHIDLSSRPICYEAFNNPPRNSICSYCPTQKTLKDGKVHRSTTRTPSGGKIRHFKIIASPLKNTKGEVVAAIEMVNDITREKRAEQLLKEERRTFFTVLQKAPYGAVIIDRKGKYLYANQEFTRITGYDLTDVPTGMDWFTKAYPDPDYRREVLQGWKKDIGTKGITRTFRVRCKDGQEKDIEFRPTTLSERRYLFTIADVTERKKSEVNLLHAREELERRVKERTEQLAAMNHALEQENAARKQIQETLKEREAHLRAIIDCFDGFIYVCSRDFKVEFMNDKLLQRTGYDGTGELCFKVLHDRDSVCPWCVNERVFRGETVRWEVKSPKDNKWWYVVNSPLYHPDGRVSKQAMIFDITERKRSEEEILRLNRDLEAHVAQLRAANADLETFSYSISHDLKTPAIAVEGFSRLVLERHGSKLDEKGKNLLRMIGESAVQMRELIDNLLAYFALGRKKLTYSPIDMEKMVQDVFDQLRAVHRGRQLYLSVKPAPPAKGDTTMLRQVIMNLLSNAIKYSRGKETTDIVFGGWTESDKNVYYVRDNGVGFAMEHVGRLFEVFERLHRPEEFEGTGIGLATVKRIVQRHGGEVWAFSRINEGATFYFSIPTIS